jgi:hypothetical protein
MWSHPECTGSGRHSCSDGAAKIAIVAITANVVATTMADVPRRFCPTQFKELRPNLICVRKFTANSLVD